MESPIYTLQNAVKDFASVKSSLDKSMAEGTAEYPPSDRDNDLAINFAMKASDDPGRNPRDIAEELAEFLRTETDYLDSVSVADPGFVNCNFRDSYLLELVQSFGNYGSLPVMNTGEGRSILLEFVSANPTGPLHVGHGRGAVYGDVLGRLFEAHDYNVTREYYVNDTGEQIKRLAESLNLRARESAGEEVTFTDDHYRGQYIKEIVAEEGITPGMDLDQCANLGVDRLLERIFDDLNRSDVSFDSVKRETEVASREELDDLIKNLEDQGHIERQDGAIFLRTSKLGDDKDRVLVRDDNTPTYFGNDLLYHHKKFKRGFDHIIDVWGHDHHGYQDRVYAGLDFLGHNLNQFKIELYQLVNLYRGGEPVSMSTREGEYVPLSDLVSEVGVDAVRFNFLTKSHESPLDFDIEVATRENEENPVYYVQYAHTRLAGILRESPGDLLEGPVSQNLSKKGHDLLFKSLNYRYHLSEATRSRDPHRITHYLIELARKFHSYYGEHRVIDPNNPQQSGLRLTIVRFLKKLFEKTLNVLGVTAPERM